jgi:hypothetical protein
MPCWKNQEQQDYQTLAKSFCSSQSGIPVVEKVNLILPSPFFDLSATLPAVDY